MPETHHLSRSAFDRLQAELHDLSTRGRVEIASKIEAARELGDLTENGDYQAAKEEQGHLEARIRKLETVLRDAEIVEGGATDSVETGSIVELRYEDDDETERFLIGSIEERPAGVQVVSPGSPLGSALLGARPGDQVEFEAPSGVLKVEVVGIEG